MVPHYLPSPCYVFCVSHHSRETEARERAMSEGVEQEMVYIPAFSTAYNVLLTTSKARTDVSSWQTECGEILYIHTSLHNAANI